MSIEPISNHQPPMSQICTFNIRAKMTRTKYAGFCHNFGIGADCIEPERFGLILSWNTLNRPLLLPMLVLIKQHRRLLLLWLLLPLLTHIYPASHGGDEMTKQHKQICERLPFAAKKESNAPTSILFYSHAHIAIERGSNNRILFRYDLPLCVA